MLTGLDFVLGVLCPSLVAAVVLAAPSLFPRGNGGWAGPVVLAAGFMTGYPLIAGAAPAFPGLGAGDRIFWLAIPIAIIAAVDACVRFPAIVRMALAAGVFGATLWWLMQPAAESRTPGEWWALWAVLAGVLLVDWWCADSALRTDHSATSYAGLLCIAAAACMLILLSGSQKFAQQGGALVAAGATGLVLLFCGLSRATVTHGAALATVGIVGSLLAISIEPLFVNVKVYNALLLAAAPVMLRLGLMIRMERGASWKRVVVRLLLPAIPPLIALALAGSAFVKAMSETGQE